MKIHFTGPHLIYAKQRIENNVSYLCMWLYVGNKKARSLEDDLWYDEICEVDDVVEIGKAFDGISKITRGVTEDCQYDAGTITLKIEV